MSDDYVIEGGEPNYCDSDGNWVCLDLMKIVEDHFANTTKEEQLALLEKARANVTPEMTEFFEGLE